MHFKAQQENNLFVYDGGWTGKDAWSDAFSSVDSSKVLARFSPDYWQEHGIDNAAMSIYNAKDCPDVCISPVGALNTLEFYEPIAQELASTIVLLNESRLSAEQGEYLSALGFFTLASIDLTPGGKIGTGQVVKKVTARAGDSIVTIPKGSGVAKGLTGNPMYKHAVTQFKRAGWTNVGRGVTKHPNILGINVPKDQVQKALMTKYGSQAGVNRAAADALKNIMRNGVQSTKNTKAYGQVTEFKLDNGMGARFSSQTNAFIGFLGRGL